MKNTNMFRRMSQAKKLALLLGIGGLNGSIAIAALSGIFTIKNSPVIALTFLAGPASMLSAAMMDGDMKERAITALISGIIATLIVILAATFGPKLLGFLNINILKISGALAIAAIALLVAGIKIPDNVPIMIIIAGLVLALMWR
ncbi:MAG: hypothetical protein WCK90_02930 [archaeon]